MMNHILPALWLIPAVEIVSAVSSSAVKQEELEQKFWISKWFKDIEALLDADACNGIVVSGSVDYHEKVLAACIKNNLSVFVEKPPASSLAALTDLALAAQEKNIVIGVGLNLPHTEIILRVERFVKEVNTFIHGIKIEYHTNKPRSPLWNLDSLMKSFLLAIAVHPLSLAQHFLGKSMKLSYAKIQTSGDAIGLRIVLECDEHLVEVISSNNMAKHICDFEFELGNGERLKANGLKSLVRSENGREYPIWSPSPLNLNLNSNGYLKEMNEFIDQAASRKPRNELYDAIPIYKIIEKILNNINNFD